MKRIVSYASLLIVFFTMASCHRNYKVNYARVPVDSTAHNDFVETEPDKSWEEDPLIEVSDLDNNDLRVNDPNRKKAMRDLDDYMSGKELSDDN